MTGSRRKKGDPRESEPDDNLTVIKWKWCLQCPNRITDAVRRDRNWMAIDTCGKMDRGFYLYPSMDKYENRLVGPWCPYYAEALVEQANK